jgi:two-component system response regulator PilR (NtrC family)
MSNHCLIVEDDAVTATALSRVVQVMGFTVAVATSLAEARSLISDRVPELILLDLKLPDGDGLELMLELHDVHTTRFIVITGDTSQQAAIESLRAEADDFLLKPVTLSQLRDTVTKTTQRLIDVNSDKAESQGKQDTAEAGEPTPIEALVGKSFWTVEKDLLFATLDSTGGDKAEAARLLGISLKTLYNRLHAYS